MDSNTPGFPVLRYLPEFAQTHVHWLIQWCIQPSHPLSLPSLFALNLSQYQGLFQWVSSLQVASTSASVLPMNIQGWFPLGLTGLISFAVQGTLRSLLQHRSSLASLLAYDHVFWPLLTLSFLVHFVSLLGVRPALLSGTNHSGFPAGESGSRGPHRKLGQGDQVHQSQEQQCRRRGWP